MLNLPLITLFTILVFLSTEKQSVALREFSHATKLDILGTLLSRFFKGYGPTSSIYVSTLKDLALLVSCQSNVLPQQNKKAVSPFYHKKYFW